MPTRRQAAGDRRPGLKLTAAICATGLALATFDQSSVTAALAAIRDDLDVEITALQWVTTLLPLTAAVALPLSGTLGDLWGARATMQAGLLVFAVGAVLVLVSTDLRTLLVARAVQGLGSALMLPNGAALLGRNATDDRRRSSAFGSWLMFSSLGVMLGPLVGGVLAQTLDWRLTFAVVVPVAVLGVSGLRRLEDTPAAGTALSIWSAC